MIDENEKICQENRKFKEKLEIMSEIHNILLLVINSCDNCLKISTDDRYQQLMNKFEDLENRNTINKQNNKIRNKGCLKLRNSQNKKKRNRRVDHLSQSYDNNSFQSEEFLCETVDCDLIFDNKSNFKIKLRSDEQLRNGSDLNRNKRKTTNKSNKKSKYKTRFKKRCDKLDLNLRDNESHEETDSDCETYDAEKVKSKTKDCSKDINCFWPGCDAVFRDRFDLQDHIWRHSGQKSFICEWPECGKEYANKRGLVRHLGIHLEKPKYACDWPGCEYTSQYAEGVRVHKRRHTDERAFKCSWPSCEWSFRQSHHLKVHLLKHTGEKPFLCDLSTCDKRFQSKQAMKFHFERVHNN